MLMSWPRLFFRAFARPVSARSSVCEIRPRDVSPKLTRKLSIALVSRSIAFSNDCDAARRFSCQRELHSATSTTFQRRVTLDRSKYPPEFGSEFF